MRGVYLMGLVGLLLVGCRSEAPVEIPEWNPDTAAQKAISMYDTNGDGMLDKKEYSQSPALAKSPWIDADNDGSISAEEIRNRIQLYKERAIVTQFFCRVLLNGQQPVADAQVELIPEEFLSDFIRPVYAVTGPDGVAVIEETQVGLYRVKITHPTLKVRPEYNENTTLGVEVSPVTVPGQAGPTPFSIRASR